MSAQADAHVDNPEAGNGICRLPRLYSNPNRALKLFEYLRRRIIPESKLPNPTANEITVSILVSSFGRRRSLVRNRVAKTQDGP